MRSLRLQRHLKTLLYRCVGVCVCVCVCYLVVVYERGVIGVKGMGGGVEFWLLCTVGCYVYLTRAVMYRLLCTPTLAYMYFIYKKKNFKI